MAKLKSKKTVIIIAVAIILVVFIVGRIFGNMDNTATTEEDNGTAVETAAVQMGTIEETTTLKGTLEGDKEVDVAPSTSGTVQYIGVAVGDYVYSGQTICTIDNSNYQFFGDEIAFLRRKGFGIQKLGGIFKRPRYYGGKHTQTAFCRYRRL